MTGPVLIFGATSGIGACAMRAASARGIAVRAFGRSADRLAPSERIEPFVGDALEPADVARALKGASAVIQALGVKERLSMLWQEERLFSEATRLLIPQMQTAGVKRLIAVTGLGAGRSIAALSRIEQAGHRALLGRPYADKDRQEALILDSDLDWTIVRPVILTNGAASGRVQVLSDPASWRNGVVSRREVGGVLIDLLQDQSHIRADVVVTR